MLGDFNLTRTQVLQMPAALRNGLPPALNTKLHGLCCDMDDALLPYDETHHPVLAALETLEDSEAHKHQAHLSAALEQVLNISGHPLDAVDFAK